MAINQNHLFEDLEGRKCAVVEKNVSAERVAFLQKLLAFNGLEVVVAASPPPKGAAPIAEGESPQEPATFTVGVTDVRFNATNAIFGRSLFTPEGHVVTLAYWQQRDSLSADEVPYFTRK